MEPMMAVSIELTAERGSARTQISDVRRPRCLYPGCGKDHGPRMRQYSWTLTKRGKVPTVGIGTIEEVENAVHRCQLEGIPSSAWLVEALIKRQDLAGAARYSHAVGEPEEWNFAWIAVDM